MSKHGRNINAKSFEHDDSESRISKVKRFFSKMSLLLVSSEC